ncbi:hypothetical protein GY45DRAFT_1410907, partial [Cubamyces sp. BRFM 1775]
MPSKKFAELTAGLPRRQLNLLVQFHTNHVPLQFYLARIGKVDAATCPTCGSAPETVAYFLLACPPTPSTARYTSGPWASRAATSKLSSIAKTRYALSSSTPTRPDGCARSSDRSSPQRAA